MIFKDETNWSKTCCDTRHPRLRYIYVYFTIKGTNNKSLWSARKDNICLAIAHHFEFPLNFEYGSNDTKAGWTSYSERTRFFTVRDVAFECLTIKSIPGNKTVAICDNKTWEVMISREMGEPGYLKWLRIIHCPSMVAVVPKTLFIFFKKPLSNDGKIKSYIPSTTRAWFRFRIPLHFQLRYGRLPYTILLTPCFFQVLAISEQYHWKDDKLSNTSTLK